MIPRTDESRAEAAWCKIHTPLTNRQLCDLFQISNSASLYQWVDTYKAGNKYPAVPLVRQEQLRSEALRILNGDPPGPKGAAPVAEPAPIVDVAEPPPLPAIPAPAGLVHVGEKVDLAQERREMSDRIAELTRELAGVRQDAAVAAERHTAALGLKDVELDLLRADVVAARRTIDHQKRDVRTLSNALVVVQLAPTD